MFHLENEYLKLAVNEIGAELVEIKGKKENTDFLWNRDPKYWKLSAPVLFPCVGGLKNNQYKIDGKVFSLSKHGFARDSIFNMIEKSNDKLIFELSYSEKSLAVYPYKFLLRVIYTLVGNTITNTYEVRNMDNKEIFFGIGGHPAFMCPLDKDASFEDYYLEFEKDENADIMLLSDEGFFTRKNQKFLDNTNILELKHEYFIQDALVFNRLNSKKVKLKSKKSNKNLEFDFSGFPTLGIWQPYGANFICLEPWISFGDYVDSDGDFKQKDDIVKLEEGVFSESFKMTFNE